MSFYTVSQITQYLRELLDSDTFLGDLYITGEVSNLSKSSAGHYYFTLKDSESQLRCVMFRPALGAEGLDNGASVTAHGRIGIYAARGEVQFVADLVQPQGVGELHMKFLRLKAKLEEEGLFDPSRKRRLPEFPKRIAVVTSRTGAVFHDIQNIIGRRWPLAELALAHTPVQGPEAPANIVAALRAVNQAPGIDVVILARGGGSLEELWAFNEESVARAVHGSRVPVVSAVGHETDFTICDFVADVRAPTPSAAAELVAPDQAVLRRRVLELGEAARGLALDALRRLREEVRHAATRLSHLAPDTATPRQRVDELTRAAGAVLARDLALHRERVRGLALQLGALQPQGTLARGYALIERRADGRLVSRVADVQPGDAIGVRVSDGRFEGQVTGADVSIPAPTPAAAGRRRARNPPNQTEQMTLFQ